MNLDLTGWTIVYDLDGTLVDSAPDLHAALNYTLALRKLGPLPLSAIRDMIGDGAKALIRKGLSDHNQPIDSDLIDSVLWPAFIEYYGQNATQLSQAFEGVVTSLEAFAAAGATQMVCTNKAEALAKIVLRELELADYFAAMSGGDSYAYRKPDARHILTMLDVRNCNPKRAIMVGDSQTDARAARLAELPFVFVTFGYGPYPNPEDNTPYIVDAWSDMPSVIRTVTKTAI